MPIRHLASQLKYSVPLVIIGCGLALLVVGFSSVENVVFDERTFLRLLLIFLFLGATIEGLRRYLNLGYYFSCAALTFILCLAAAKIGALLVVLVFSLACLSVGSWVLKLMNLKPEGALAMCFVLGSGVIGTFGGLLAMAPINNVITYTAILLAPILLNAKRLNSFFNDVFRAAKTFDPQPSVNFVKLFLASFFVFYIYVCLLPEVGWDALSVHLFIPEYVKHFGSWSFNPDLYVFSLMPNMFVWNFSIVNMLGGEAAARLLNLGCLIVAAILGRELFLWAGGSTKQADIGTLILVSSPFCFLEVSNLFTDLAWSMYILASLSILLSAWERAGFAKNVYLVALLLGFSAAAKAVTLILLPLFLAISSARLFESAGTKNLFHASIGILIFLTVGSIPYLTSFVVSQNPVFPFFNEIFASPFYPAINFEQPYFNTAFSWRLPYEGVFYSSQFMEGKVGSSGFQWLLLIPISVFFFILRKDYRFLLMFGIFIAIIALVFIQQSYLRYIFPALIIGSFMVARISGEIMFSKADELLGKFATIFAVVLNMAFLTSATFSHIKLPLMPAFDQTARKNYIDEVFPLGSAIEFVNSVNLDNQAVAMLGPTQVAGVRAEVFHGNWYNFKFQDDIRMKLVDAVGVDKALKNNGIRYLILSDFYGEPEGRDLIRNRTSELFRLGYISVRIFEQEFSIELLTVPTFTDVGNWFFSDGVEYRPETGEVTVSVKNTVSQFVEVAPLRSYLNTVSAKCATGPAQGRIQINWLDADKQFISTSIEVFDCQTEFTSQSMSVTSPPEARFAIVYTGGHTDLPIIFNRNSLQM